MKEYVVIPIPDPNRLFPPRLPSSGSSFSNSLAENLLQVGLFPLYIAFTIGCGALAWILLPLLAIPGGIAGLYIFLAISRSPIVVLGIIETLFYSSITFAFSGGIDNPDSLSPWILTAIVFLLFLITTYSAWKENR